MNPALSTSLEGKLPGYTSALALLTRSLALRHSTHPAASQRLRLRGIETSTFEQPMTLTLDSTHGPLSIVADAAEHSALLSIALDSEPKRASALANMWLADWLARLDTGDGAVPSVKAIAFGSHATDVHGLQLTIDANGAAMKCAVVGLPAALAADYERAWTRASVPAPLDTVDDLVLPAAIRLRSRMCSPSTLASLRRHDVLLGWQPSLPYTQGSPIERASLRLGAPRGRQLCAGVRIDTHTVTLETPVTLATAAQPDDFDPLAGASSDPSADPIVPVGAIELPVHIELLSVNLSVAQIGSLQPGYVLDLPLPLADATIRLVSYGQTLAFGKLVAVGENLGVQINRMAASDERQS
ncbi:type III secretion system cytoplasmic ring protein SctQ [Trinickia acidisoli]|uniref:type III secretion system cytoplasmic ring protein SctQ n=1 Tax=Trinickia acidisoli TaxID=2767482 RepID=UPI001A8C0F77|nr:type III secretion system cytoplasmic ring protein SctQ [Trinickia acidisoli]